MIVADIVMWFCIGVALFAGAMLALGFVIHLAVSALFAIELWKEHRIKSKED